MKNSTFARFARAFFIFGHLADVLDLSTTWNDLFCSCPDDVSIWWQMFNFVSLPLKRWFQFNSRTVWTHFASVMTLNNSEMIAEMRSYILIWRSCCRRRRVCLNSLLRRASRDAQVSENHREATWWGGIDILRSNDPMRCFIDGCCIFFQYTAQFSATCAIGIFQTILNDTTKDPP